MKKARTSYTIRQAMHNPASGVPLAGNAANLINFFSRDGLSDAGILTDAADGGIVFDTTVMGSGATPRKVEKHSDTSFTVMGGIENGTQIDAIVAGAWPQLSVTDDCLMIISAIAGVDTAENSTIFRMGNNTTALLRLHSPYDSPSGATVSGSFDDTVQTGQVNTLSPISGNRIPAGNDMCAILAIDRTADLMRTKMWDHTANVERVDLVPTTNIAALGEANLSTDVGVSGTDVAVSMQGRFYGVAVYEFPSTGLPADYFEAAIQMSDAWRNGKYTFWPYWGYS